MNTREKTAVAASFAITSALGAWFLSRYWAGRGLATEGPVRSVAFVGIMAAVHLVALRLYGRQERVSAGVGHGGQGVIAGLGWVPSRLVDPTPGYDYRPAVILAILQQVVLLGLSSLLLDSGRAFRVCGVAAIAHWVAIALILAARPSRPTRFDVVAIRYGFLPFVILVGSLASVVLGSVAR
jgi:hypothetical protein